MPRVEPVRDYRALAPPPGYCFSGVRPEVGQLVECRPGARPRLEIREDPPQTWKGVIRSDRCEHTKSFRIQWFDHVEQLRDEGERAKAVELGIDVEFELVFTDDVGMVPEEDVLRVVCIKSQQQWSWAGYAKRAHKPPDRVYYCKYRLFRQIEDYKWHAMPTVSYSREYWGQSLVEMLEEGLEMVWDSYQSMLRDNIKFKGGKRELLVGRSMAFHMLGDVFHRYTGGRFPKLEFGNVAGHLETASAGSAGEVAAAEAAKMGMKELKTTIPDFDLKYHKAKPGQKDTVTRTSTLDPATWGGTYAVGARKLHLHGDHLLWDVEDDPMDPQGKGTWNLVMGAPGAIGITEQLVILRATTEDGQVYSAEANLSSNISLAALRRMIGSAMFSDEFPLGNASVGENTLVFAFKEGEFIGEMAGTSEAEVLIFGGEGKAALPLGGWPEPKVLELRYVDMSG